MRLYGCAWGVYLRFRHYKCQASGPSLAAGVGLISVRETNPDLPNNSVSESSLEFRDSELVLGFGLGSVEGHDALARRL